MPRILIQPGVNPDVTPGETNTASNAGLTGFGLVLPKVGVDLPFKSISVGNNLTLTDDTGNKSLLIDTIQGIKSSDSPTFSALTLNNTLNVVGVGTFGSYSEYQPSTDLATTDIELIRWGSDPTAVWNGQPFRMRWSYADQGLLFEDASGAQTFGIAAASFTGAHYGNHYGFWFGSAIGTGYGGTNITSYAQGDILYASATNTLAKLPKDTNATRYLSNTGSSNNPAWTQINLANGVTGDLPFANLTQGTARSVLGVAGNATADVASIQGTANQVLRVASDGLSLAFGQVNLASSSAVTGTLPVGNGGTGVTSLGALTKTDDTNVTITLGGSPTTALVNPASITVGWTGTLAASRLNSNVVQSIVNDTNITGSISAQTLTLGWTGTLAAGRLNSNVVQAITNDTNITGSITAQNLTLGWTGQLGLTRGGTNANLTAVNGGIVYSTASALAISSAGSSGQILRSGGAGVPTWSTATFPSASPAAGTYLRGDGTNWITSTLILPNNATSSRLVYATGTNTWGESANLTFSGSTLTLAGIIGQSSTYSTSVSGTVTQSFNDYTNTVSSNISSSATINAYGINSVINSNAAVAGGPTTQNTYAGRFINQTGISTGINSNEWYGVYAESRGGFGTAANHSNYGVRGLAGNGRLNYGGYFAAISTSATSTTGYGVYITASGSGTNYGLIQASAVPSAFGTATPQSYGMLQISKTTPSILVIEAIGSGVSYLATSSQQTILGCEGNFELKTGVSFGTGPVSSGTTRMRYNPANTTFWMNGKTYVNGSDGSPMIESGWTMGVENNSVTGYAYTNASFVVGRNLYDPDFYGGVFIGHNTNDKRGFIQVYDMSSGYADLLLQPSSQAARIIQGTTASMGRGAQNQIYGGDPGAATLKWIDEFRIRASGDTTGIRVPMAMSYVTTTSATPTTLATIPIATSTSYSLRIRVVGARTGGVSGAAGDYGVYERAVAVRNLSGTVTVNGGAGAVDITAIYENQAGWVVDVIQSSTNVLVRVTGAASNNVTWGGTYELLEIQT